MYIDAKLLASALFQEPATPKTELVGHTRPHVHAPDSIGIARGAPTCSHRGPPYPSKHAHTSVPAARGPRWQVPWPLHSIAPHEPSPRARLRLDEGAAPSSSPQPSPTYPAAHWHRPSMHWPLPEQPLGQCGCHASHARPDHPAAHRHTPIAPRPFASAPIASLGSLGGRRHVPCPEQSAGHRGASHAAPCQPRAHSHLPLTQSPRPEHRPGQGRATEQSSPPNPDVHAHRPCVGRPGIGTHVPWPEQPCSHPCGTCSTAQLGPLHE